MTTSARIIGVALTALVILVFVLNGFGQDAGMAFAFLGIFFTLPTLLILGLVAAVERRLFRAGHALLARLTGLGFGLAVPLFLYWMAPNKANAAAALEMLGPLCVGTGLLWSLTSLAVPAPDLRGERAG